MPTTEFNPITPDSVTTGAVNTQTLTVGGEWASAIQAPAFGQVVLFVDEEGVPCFKDYYNNVYRLLSKKKEEEQEPLPPGEQPTGPDPNNMTLWDYIQEEG